MRKYRDIKLVKRYLKKKMKKTKILVNSPVSLEPSRLELSKIFSSKYSQKSRFCYVDTYIITYIKIDT